MRNKYFFFFWALLMGLVMACFVKYFNSQPVIVFMGGGSAKNYIERKDKIIDNFPRSFYLNLPSLYSWLSLVEEIEKTGEEENDSIRTTIICLSADTINHKDTMLIHHNHIFKTNRIIGVHLGDDPLCLYAKDLPKSIESLINSNDSTIASSNLIKIIDSIAVEYIYTTKDRSGTLQAYENLLNSIPVKNQTKKSIKNKLGVNIFYDFYKQENFEQFNDSLVFLGSEYYKPKLDKSWKQFYIKDTAKKAVTKPICIYFATYKNKLGVYSISAPVVKFLRHFKDSIDPKVWEKIERRGNWLDEAKKLEHNKEQSEIIYLNRNEDKFYKRKFSK